MALERTERRLVAILAADVVGYSRLMGADEEGTLSTLNAHLAEFIESLIADHKGRIVKKMGDGLLVEFASVVDAVHCAVAWQEGMAVRNADADQNGNIVFRIGINIGDVIVQDDDVFGDGVNVAARLEGLAEPGGICISRSARDQIRDKLEYGLEDLGEVAVKNIARPVRVFRVLPKGVVVSTSVKPPAGKRRWAPIGGAGLALLLIGALIWWQPWQGYIDQPAPGSGQSAKTEKPSIAVMPFANRSNDSAQAYFSSGITEDITTDLSKVTGLFITPGSATRPLSRPGNRPTVIGRKLGVRYILEGGVRRADKHLRITARLIDTSTGIQVWAERYDRELKDIFRYRMTLLIVWFLPCLKNYRRDRCAVLRASIPLILTLMTIIFTGAPIVFHRRRQILQRRCPCLKRPLSGTQNLPADLLARPMFISLDMAIRSPRANHRRPNLRRHCGLPKKP